MTAKFFIITAAVLACLIIISAGLAVEGFKKAKATQAKLDEALQAATEAKNLLLECEAKIIDMQAQAAKARQVESQTLRDMETKRDAFTQNFSILRSEAGSLDSGLLDDGVRQCAIDAYRAAVCADPDANHSPMPGTSDTGTP